MSYRATIVKPEYYAHWQALSELADGLTGGLQELGVHDPAGRQIVLGGHLPYRDMPKDAIVFNTEVADSGWFTKDYLHLLSHHEVWDYSLSNITKLARHSITAKHCPIGYHECLTRIENGTWANVEEKSEDAIVATVGRFWVPQLQDIDVLFYGSMTPRREPIWKSIEATGLNCVHLFGIYGAARDAYIARSKIVLNMHAYPMSPREDVRLSYLWANRAFVLSENNGTASGMSWSGQKGGPFELTSAQLPESCKEWVRRDVDRRFFAGAIHDSFKLQRQADYLRPLIAAQKETI